MPEDERRFVAEADLLRQGLNERFFRSGLGQYDNGSATSYILPLAFDMVPAADRTRVMARLVGQDREVTTTATGRTGWLADSG